MISPAVMVPWLLTMALKASLLFAAAFVVAGLLRRASAATRHVVWLASFVAVLALPLAGALLPALRVPVAEGLARFIGSPYQEIRYDVSPEDLIRYDVGVAVPATPAPAEVVVGRAGRATVMAPPPALAGKTAVAVVRSSSGWKMNAHSAARPLVVDEAEWQPVATAVATTSAWPMRVFLVWLFGFVMVAVAFAVGVLRTHIVACTALPASGDTLADEVEVLSAQLGIVRDVRAVTWPGPAMPMTWGAFRPVVLLPEDARSWPAARRREVLTHELAHVKRGDWTARLIAALACAVYWFNPLVWMAASRMRNEQELACDDTVLAGGVEPSDYAAHLLEVARGLRVPSFAMANASVAMARPSQLTGRLLAVLDESRVRVAQAPRRTVGMAALGAAVLLATVGAATPVSRGLPKEWQVSADQGPWAVEPPPPEPAVYHEAMPAVAPRGAVSVVVDCWDDAGRGSGRGRGAGQHSSSHSSSHNSRGREDGSSTKRVTLTLGEGNCSIEVRMIGDVVLTEDETDVRSVARDGSFRITEEGNGPERRLDIFWRNGQLVHRWQVDGSEVPETPELKAWLARSLQMAVVRTGYDVEGRTMRAYRAGGLDSVMRLSESSGSDYSRRIMMQTVLDSARVPEREAARIARQALGMSSDYEKAELLITVARKLRLDGEVQEAMVEAAGNMSSDYEKRRVLSAALARQELSARATDNLLRSAGQMSSDYEKAELLIEFSRGRPLTATNQAGFLDATSSMSSDYERRRVLAALVARADAVPAIAEPVCRQSQELSSDYERAELLVQLARKFGSSSEVRACIRQSAERMSSDYERDRVLAVLGRMSQ